MATLLVSIGVAACSGAGRDDTAPSAAGLEASWAAEASASATRLHPATPSRLVAVVGRHRRDAIDLLSRLGLETEIEWRAGCATDIVVAQSPGPRRVTRSETVTLTVETGGESRGAIPGPPDSRQPHCSIGPAGKRRHHRFANDVEFLIGNQTVEPRLDAPQNRRSWLLCEHGEGCASPLTKLAEMTRPAVVRVMTGPCPDSYVLLRRELASTLGRSATVIDKRVRPNCRDAVGIQVWVDSEGRISAVNWIL